MKCPQCDFRLSCTDSRLHEKIDHTRIRRYKCKKCANTVTTCELVLRESKTKGRGCEIVDIEILRLIKKKNLDYADEIE